jgi:hypothetical protein
LTRIKQARIGLYLVAFANVMLIAMSWPDPTKLTELATLIVCGGSVVLAYREEPARFHRRVHRTEAITTILAPVVILSVMVLLAKTHLL